MNLSDALGMTEKRDAAFEIKFLLPGEAAERALAWSRRELVPDPHLITSKGDSYSVNSLYFDTAELDVYHRNGSYGKAKYRVRRYGEEPSLFLERKLKTRGLVSKKRTRIPDQDISLLAAPEPAPDWIGQWFHRRLLVRQLFPQCQIRYERVARVGMSPQGPIRFTMDRNVRSFITKEHRVLNDGEWKSLLNGHCIMELKFRHELPVAFKTLIDELCLTPQPVSKYRLSVQAAGLEPKPEEVLPATNGHVMTAELAASEPRPSSPAAADTTAQA
jgi:hypothetical protein